MDNYILVRDFPNGLRAAVILLTYGRGRIIVGRIETWENGYDQNFWYHTPAVAVAALNAWDGIDEPNGWFRNPNTGRRRINGDPTTEYINL